MPEFTTTKSGIKKCKILVNLIISKINATIFENFLFREFRLLPRPLKQFDLYSCLVLKGGYLCYSNFAFIKCCTRDFVLLNYFDEAYLLLRQGVF
jgi:hypothetical protein